MTLPFYTRDPNNRSAWIPTDTPDRFDRFVALNPPVLVHGKMGRYKKSVEGIAYAISKEYLLVAVDNKKYSHLDTYGYKDGLVWCQLYNFDGCVEGFRFKRNVIGLIKLLLKLSREAQKNKKTKEKLDEIEANRGHRIGQCSVCFGDFIIENGNVVLHGFQRPGYGHVVGRCPGVGWANLEVSSNGAVNYLEKSLKPHFTVRKEELANFEQRTQFFVTTYTRKSLAIKRGEAGFEEIKKVRKEELKREVESLQEEVERFTVLIANWKPQKWPRKDPPK